ADCSATGDTCDHTKKCCDDCYTCRCGTPWGANCRCDYYKARCDT
uniref:Omega-plectoxin-Pt1a n=1 Tax=Plectreurys tristis TaxID=33319 RepID=TX22A_PLETR|nr:RecName: Full=Omega-plectoxin-Pt1a; Short=Omega-PLTX-Pt1a; AltName: Full=PLTX-II; AltName: Full=Toxin PLTX-2 [Plectreurys tristis]AAB28419.1 PLTX-II=presynaptic calcium channel blocker [Plectreurys tristes=spiders, venom, Peptide, 44 aa] [Araneae]